MTRAQEVFQRNKDLSDKWGSICGSNWFAEVLTFAQAHLMEVGASDEQMKGARLMIQTLISLTDKDVLISSMPRPKLVHDLETDLHTVRSPKS